MEEVSRHTETLLGLGRGDRVGDAPDGLVDQRGRSERRLPHELHHRHLVVDDRDERVDRAGRDECRALLRPRGRRRRRRRVGDEARARDDRGDGADPQIGAESNTVVSRLGERSVAIGKILNVIEDVAEQTNLLALNAAILAAQAGEYGKGFSVVAAEIRELSERTASSTRDIANLIRSVQEEVGNALKTMPPARSSSRTACRSRTRRARR